MIRIAGINLDDKKHTEIALTSIFGIGRPLARTLCLQLKIDFTKPLGKLDDTEIESLRNKIRTLVIEGDLRKKISLSIKRLIDLKSYRGRRHRSNLPVRGQRTHSNARTCRRRQSITLDN